MMRISLFFVSGHIIILFTQLAQTIIGYQANFENMSISMKWSCPKFWEDRGIL